MQLHPYQVYHLYNRGINRQRLFYEQRNYPFFLEKIRKYITPHCDLLAYCLLPNHFHLLLQANEQTILPFHRATNSDSVMQAHSGIQMSTFSHGMQLLLSSYAKAINKGHKRAGSLFTQNTHAKRTSGEDYRIDYTLWCFLYIHNNPVAAGLVQSPEMWPFSSYREYLGHSTAPLCNIELGRKLLSLDINELIEYNSIKIPEHIIDKIF
jgi:putative transposase